MAPEITESSSMSSVPEVRDIGPLTVLGPAILRTLKAFSSLREFVFDRVPPPVRVRVCAPGDNADPL